VKTGLNSLVSEFGSRNSNTHIYIHAYTPIHTHTHTHTHYTRIHKHTHICTHILLWPASQNTEYGYVTMASEEWNLFHKYLRLSIMTRIAHIYIYTTKHNIWDSTHILQSDLLFIHSSALLILPLYFHIFILMFPLFVCALASPLLTDHHFSVSELEDEWVRSFLSYVFWHFVLLWWPDAKILSFVSLICYVYSLVSRQRIL